MRVCKCVGLVLLLAKDSTDALVFLGAGERRFPFLQAALSDEDIGEGLKRGSASKKPSVSVWYAPGEPMPGLDFAHGIAALTASSKFREEARAEIIICDEATACRSIVEEQAASEKKACLVAFAGALETAKEIGAQGVVCTLAEVGDVQEAGLIPFCQPASTEEAVEAAQTDLPALIITDPLPDTEFHGALLRIIDAAAEKDVILEARDNDAFDGAILRHSSPDTLLAAVATIRSTQSRTFAGFLSNAKSTTLLDDDELKKAKSWASFVMSASDAGLTEEFKSEDSADDEALAAAGMVEDQEDPLAGQQPLRVSSDDDAEQPPASQEQRPFDPDKGDYKGF